MRPAAVAGRAGASDGRTAPGDPRARGTRVRELGSRSTRAATGSTCSSSTPDGDGPFPTVLNIHGGPEWHERDRFDPETQAFVDAGYAVAIVNYRGSTGYGVAFREALIGRVCLDGIARTSLRVSTR